jgi:flagellar motor switch protein FliG
MGAAKKDKTTEWGLTHAVEAVSALEGEARETLLNQIRKMDPEVAKAIEDRMFRFEDLLLANQQGLNKLLSSLPEKSLYLSLRGASPQILEKFYSCFSARKVEMIKEGVEDLGPQPRSKVEEARKEMIDIAKKMLASGELVLSSSNDPLV